MALPIRVTGQDVTLTIDGEKTEWSTISITVSQASSEATAASSAVSQKTRGTKSLTGTVTGFVGPEVSAANSLSVGQLITDFALTVENDSVLPDLTDFTNIRIMSIKNDFNKDAATYSLDFEAGILN